MSRVVLALDQGTSSTRCIAYDEELRERGRGSVPVACSYPAAGLVEQDPGALVESARAAIAAALADGRIAASDVAGLAIANQTETFVLWERASGRPIHPAVVWQDRRSAAACAQLVAQGREPLVRARTGLELDATFPASKIRWLLEHVPGAARAAEAGELAYGDVASWLVHSLTGRASHVTDAGNAGRTMLCALGATSWDAELLEIFGVPAALLPPILDSDAVFGTTLRRAADRGRARRSAGVAPLGQRCFARGPGRRSPSAPAASCWCRPWPARAPRPPDGVLASTAWKRAGANELRARRLRAGRGGCDRLAGGGRGALGGVRARRARRHGRLPTTRGWSSFRRCRASERRPGAPRPGECSWGSAAATTRAEIARATVDGVLHQVADGVDGDRARAADRIDQARWRSLAQRLRRAAARRPDGGADRAGRGAPTRRPSVPPCSPV